MAGNFSAREIVKMILPRAPGRWSLALEPMAPAIPDVALAIVKGS